MFRRTQNCLFVEEEVYNWASPKSKLNRRLITLCVLFVFAGLIFSGLR